jgi:hypothetical protein
MTEEAFPRPDPMIILDALFAAKAWLDVIKRSDADMQLWISIGEVAVQQGISVQEAALSQGVPLGSQFVAFSLYSMLANWYEGGREQIGYARDNLDAGMLGFDEEGSAEDRIVAGVVEFLGLLGELEAHQDATQDDVRHAFNAISLLGEAFEAAAEWESAARCFDIGCNFVGRIGHRGFARSAGKARQYVRRIQDQQLAAGILMKSARARIAAAEVDPAASLDAYDAMYDALLALPGQPLLRMQSREFVYACLDNETYRALGALYVLSDPGLDRARLPESRRDLRLVPPISDSPMKEWLQELQGLTELLIEAERGRLVLEPKPADPSVAEADWTTWEVNHPTYYRAIPDGASFLRSAGSGNLMLVLAHEMTHIFSMNGYLGLAMLSLKTAALSLLLGLYREEETRRPNLGVLDALPELRGHSVTDLGTVERVVHVFRKLQILKSVWSSWLEGIAVFLELADPAEDREARGPTMEVLLNLIDISIQEDGVSREAIALRVAAHAADIERRYSALVSTVAETRLNTYLVARHEGYVAGYLAARAVVAAWRRSLQEPLSAEHAARLLLHLTRGATSDAVPDFSLPLERFREEAVSRHVDWVRWLSSISVGDLRAAQVPYQSESPMRSLRWLNGKLESLSAAELGKQHQDFESFGTQKAGQAWASLRGTRDDLAATSGGDRSRECMEAFADASTHARVREGFHDSCIRRLAVPLAVLPFAQVDTRFWLNSSDHAVYCMLRTSEGKGSGEPASYNGLLFTLPEDKFAALSAEFERLGSFRMRVSRVVDMVASGALSDRGFGRHALVFHYGSWFHVQMRGVFFDRATVMPSFLEEIRGRVLPDAILRFDRDQLSDGKAFTRRVKDWLASAEKFELDGDPMDVGAWKRSVEGVCDEVLVGEDRGSRELARQGLLSSVVGLAEARASQVLQWGLRAFTPFGSAHAASDLIALLVHSAQRPAQCTELWPGADELFVNSELGLDVRAAALASHEETGNHADHIAGGP